jgi:hypothetical protein
MRTPHLLVAAALLTLLAGCANGGTGAASPADSGSPSAPATAAPSPSTPSIPAPSTGPLSPTPTGKPTNGATITVVGTVQDGVEAKCLVLRTDSQSYQLMGGDPAVVRAGAHLRVTGVVRTDVMSYCMQGIPLEVTTAAPA